MANISTNITEAERPGLWSRCVAAVVRGMERQANLSGRRNMIEALEAKSDAELARMGLRREDIAYHVFKDLFYT